MTEKRSMDDREKSKGRLKFDMINDYMVRRT